MAKKKKINNENGNAQAQRRPRLFDPGWRDRPFFVKTISFSTPEAKSLANSIPYVASAACVIGFALQRYVDDIRVLSLLESVDEEIFKTLGKDLENEILKLETIVSEQGVKLETVFPNKVDVDVKFTHPYGLEYAKMVENMEKLVILLWDLHNSGIIDPVKLNKTKEKWRQLLFDAGKRITTLAKDTLNQAKQEKVQQDPKDKEAVAAKGEEAATSSVSAIQDSSETAESPVSETPEPESAGPGGNGRRAPRKTAKPGTEEQHLEVPPGAVLTGAEEAVPPLEQAV